MKRTGITWRFGVKGYAGGHKWCHRFINFDEKRNVAESSLNFWNF